MRRPALLPLPFLLLALACGGDPADAGSAGAATANVPALPHAEIAPGPHDVAVLEMGDLGTIRIELLPEIAPKTVARFVELAEDGFYDGTYFHRVIPGFMIQGGDPNTKNKDPRDDGRGRTAHRIEDEFTDYPQVRGTLAMANTGNSNSSSCQFFIVHEDTPELVGQYTAFGRVVEGMDVVDAITELEIDTYGRYGPPDRPYPVNATIERLWIERVGEGAEAETEVAAGGAG